MCPADEQGCTETLLLRPPACAGEDVARIELGHQRNSDVCVEVLDAAPGKVLLQMLCADR